MDHCSRCQRAAPAEDSEEFVYWETDADGTTLICPHCLTLSEENTLAEAARETGIPADRLAADDAVLDQMERDEGWGESDAPGRG
jgi:hypothetical protein